MKDIDKYFLSADDSCLLIIDIQERLAVVMDEKGPVIKNTNHLTELAKIHGMPIVVTEQYPKGLGPTVNEIKDPLPGYQPVEKISFDCCGEGSFNDLVMKLGRKKVIVAGMETHVCVLQTVLSLIKSGHEVHLVADAVCSRSPDNKKIAIELMRSAGAVITCTETVLFQVLKVAGTDEFRTISKMIK
ncbi:MAG: hydrolase [Nitrospirota bacterium]|nr:MAG: hydrolase [Nitrospirota bacterium]